MGDVQTKLRTDTWVPASSDEYMRAIEDPACEPAREYYYQGHMRVEMLPVGYDYSEDDGRISLAVNLFGIAKGIPLTLSCFLVGQLLGSVALSI